jgi:hypothetical protein
MEVMALDFVGPLPQSKGYKYFLSAIDTYSRYAFVEPVRDLSAASLISACKNIFSLCGFPGTVLSDRGTQFCSSEFRNFLRNFSVKWMTTCSYSPKSNGCCERFNGTVQKSIFAYLKQTGLDQFQWLLSLPAVLLNYRTSVHASTGCRPVDLFFNFRAVGLSPQSPQDISKERMYAKVNSRLHKKLRKLRTSGGPNILKPGDLVLVRNPGIFKGKFTDPGRKAIVEASLFNNAVRVKYTDSQKFDDVHMDRVSIVSRKRGEDEDFDDTASSLTDTPPFHLWPLEDEASVHLPPGTPVRSPSSRRQLPFRDRRPPQFYGEVYTH